MVSRTFEQARHVTNAVIADKLPLCRGLFDGLIELFANSGDAKCYQQQVRKLKGTSWLINSRNNEMRAEV